MNNALEIITEDCKKIRNEVKEAECDEAEKKQSDIPDKNGLMESAFLNILKLNTSFKNVRDEVNGWVVEFAMKINNEEYAPEIGECLTRINSALYLFHRQIQSSIYGKKVEE